MISGWYVVLECVKLAAQFFGALAIAKLAVGWARERYQQEKHWERRLAAYTDVVAAMSTVLQVLSQWEQEELSIRSFSDEMKDDFRKRYWSSRRTLEEARGMAMLLLPNDVVGILEDLITKLNRNDYSGPNDDFLTKIHGEWQLIEDARDKIVRDGKRDLDLAVRSLDQSPRRR